MPYGNLLADVVQGSVANTPPAFRDGNGTQVGTLCRAWVNFNGTGTVAIRASFNVSSITDNGTGDYTVNFTNAMPNANYCISGSNSVSGNGSVVFNGLRDNNQTITTTACRIGNTQPGVALVDPNFVFVAIFSS